MSNTDNLTMALLLVLSLNVIMFFVSSGLIEAGYAYANPFDPKDNFLNKFNAGNTTSYAVPSENATNLFPDTQAVGIDPEDNNVYTDVFTSIRSWFLYKTGIGWLLGILQAPAVILTAIGLSPATAWAITALWYAITLLFIVSYIFGR